MISLRMLQPIIGRVQYENYIICGAGQYGREIVKLLIDAHKSVITFMDNNVDSVGEQIEIITDNGICTIPVAKPHKYDGECNYLICVRNPSIQNKLYDQLLGVGVSDESIYSLGDVDYQYWSSLPESEYKSEVSRLYYEAFGRDLNWEHPTSYNEIINWEKVYATDNDIKAKYADKYLVREKVKAEIGEDHLVKYLGVWDSPEQIDFDTLPNSFVLKTNNGSGRNILVKDKSKLDREDACEQLRYWLERDYGYYGLATHYKGIVPKIICEEYLDGLAETAYDYDVHCFHGEPKYIWCISGSHRENARASLYDLDWRRQEGVSLGWPYDEEIAPRPEQLDMIIDFSRRLSQGFRHCRVDWYIMPDGRVLFSEITFATWGGLQKFIPEEWDYKFGEMINLG